MYKTIDLFAGLGGIRKGFELTGKCKNILSAEIDKFACLAYEHLYKENPFNDVTSEEFKEKCKGLNYDILLAGFPCQSFSIAGLKRGFLDTTRGTLFFDVVDIARQSKPKAIFLENVEGLTRHDKGKTFKVILDALNQIGYYVLNTTINDNGDLTYDVKDFIRNTKDFGLPQKRSRTYIMAIRKDLIPSNYTFSKYPIGRDKIYNNLYDLLESNVDSKYYLSDKLWKTLQKHKSNHAQKGNGFGYVIVNEGENPISNTILATGGSGKERNLVKQPNEKYKNILVGKGNEINTDGIRHMTPTEWGKLQGFINYGFIKNGVDEFSFPEKISDAQKYKLFGNSVSIPVIEQMAKFLISILEDLDGIK